MDLCRSSCSSGSAGSGQQQSKQLQNSKGQGKRGCRTPKQVAHVLSQLLSILCVSDCAVSRGLLVPSIAPAGFMLPRRHGRIRVE